MRSVVTLALLFAASSHADDFAIRAKSLQESQAATDRLLSQLKTKYSSPLTSSSVGGELDGAPPSILVRHGLMGKLRVALGTMLRATLLNRLVVGGDASPALLHIEAHEAVLNDLVLIGMAKPSGTEGRIAIDLTRVVFRSGKTQALQAVALDEEGALGLTAQVISKKALAVAGAMASSFVSGVAASQITQNQTPFGVTTQVPSGRNAILQGVAQTAADQSKRLIEEATTEKPILILEAGAQVKVFFSEEVRF